jgi:hypothetical protein
MVLLKLIELLITIDQPITIKHMKSKSIDAGNNTKKHQPIWLIIELLTTEQQATLTMLAKSNQV